MNSYCALKICTGVQGSTKRTKLKSFVFWDYSHSKGLKNKEALLNITASATIPCLLIFTKKWIQRKWEHETFAIGSPWNIHFSFLRQLFFTHQWQDLLCIVRHFINNLLWQSNYSTWVLSPIYFHPCVHIEERAISSKTRSTASCLSGCLLYYLQKEGRTFIPLLHLPQIPHPAGAIEPTAATSGWL